LSGAGVAPAGDGAETPLCCDEQDDELGDAAELRRLRQQHSG
jgi:hypothetical protein